MISASQTFINAIESDGRTFRAKILKGGVEVNCDIISFTANKGIMDSQMFTIGAVFSSTLQIVVANQATSLENEDIVLQIGVMTDAENDTFEYITYGTYTVIKVQKDVYRSTITAIGSISAKLNVILPTTAATPTIQAIASSIATTTGVPVRFVGIASGLSNTLPEALAGVTCRTALEIIAFLLGGYAIENASGGIEIRRFIMGTSALTIPPSRCLTPPLSTEELFELTGVKVIVSEETEDEEGAIVPEVSYQAGIPIRQVYESKYMTLAMFSVFSGNVIGFRFMPATIEHSLGDPRLEASDWVTVTDVDGTTYAVPCFLITASFDGGFSSIIQAFGESEIDQGVEGSTTKQIGELSGQLAITQVAATAAKAAAKSAETDAKNAKKDAKSASDSAAEALEKASLARTAADSAQKDAVSANISANAALTQLSAVESVFDTLIWIADHGQYALTEDTQVEPCKFYFVKTTTAEGDVYAVSDISADKIEYYIWTKTTDTGIDDSKQYYTVVASVVQSPESQSLYLYYELVNGSYVLTSDTGVVSGKTYYELEGMEALEPDPDDIGLYYERDTGEKGEDPSSYGLYELIGVDESVSNYIKSHLALDAQGLWLQNEDNAGKILMAHDCVKIMDETGALVASYAKNTTLGNSEGAHIILGEVVQSAELVANPTAADLANYYEYIDDEYVKTEDTAIDPNKDYYTVTLTPELGFYNGDMKVAYINGEQLYIPRAVVVDSMQIGDTELGAWRWAVIEDSRHLRLVWLGGEQ